MAVLASRGVSCRGTKFLQCSLGATMTMSSAETLRIFINKNLLKNQPEVYEDEAKYVLTFSQIIAKIINLWPGDGGALKKGFFVFMVITGVLQELSLILHLLTREFNVDTLIKAIASMMIIMQSMLKGCVFYCKSKDLNEIIQIISEEFWPSDIMGEETRNDIKKYSKSLMMVFIIQYVSAVAFLSFYVILPVTKPGKQLPHTSWFPFDVTASPYYEIIFIWQAYLTVYINENVVCAYDTLYCAICGNCVAQFRLLNTALRYIGSGKEDAISERLLQINGVTYQSMGENIDQAERKLLVICINHHQKLINITEQLNKIFGPGHLVQLFASVLGTCTACYRITTETNIEDLTFLIAFYIAHVSQLLEYCALSHELSYWGTTLPESIFGSYWYLERHSDTRKLIAMMMMRSQKPISMNALGLFELNYRSFMAIMRFTLSLYTFLSNMDN